MDGKRILNGKFSFKRLPNGSLDKTKVICVFCGRELSYHRSTSSLKYHLTAKHTANANSPPPPRSHATTDESPQKNMASKTKNKLIAAIAKWVATAFRPVNVVEDEGLADIIRIASNDWTYELPSRATIASHVEMLHEAEKAKVQRELEKTKTVALTCDYWTSLRNHNYLSVTAHFLDAQWNLQSYALTVTKTEERHLANAAAEHCMKVAGEWDIGRKVVSLTTDSARNVVAATGQLPFAQMPCIAHSVHRAVTVSLTDSPFDGALAKCRRVVGHFRHSPANQAELEKQQVAHRQHKESLAQEVPTRWNSTLEMIKRVRRNAAPLRAALGPHTTNVAMPTAAELEELKMLEALLEHCRYVSELLGGEKYVSCSAVLPALCHLSRVMEVIEDDPAYLIKFKQTFAADMEVRKEKTDLAWLKIAAALDPRFKDLKCLNKADRAEVWGLIHALLQDMERERPAKREPPTKKPTLMLAHESSTDEEEDGVEQCLERYKAEPLADMGQCPQEWWSAHEGAHSEMARLARKYLAAPATSVPSERLFSVSGHVVQKKRGSLSSENVNRHVCLSSWLKAK